jgi:hypothetical protein
VEGNFADPLQLRADIGSALHAIILRCLQVDPEQRYQSAEEVESDLTAFVSELGIDSPTELLVRYLTDPGAVTAEINEKALQHAIKKGAQAQKKGDIATALGHYNRALAMDEGNPKVLAALQRIGRRSLVRRVVWSSVGAAAAMSLAAVIIGSVAGWWPLGSDATASTTDSVTDDTVPNAGNLPGATVEDRDSPASVDKSATALPESIPDKGKPDPHANGIARRVAKGPRTVVFQPFPANVSIAINGAAPRAFGPSFREIELEPGVHRFKIVGAHECCIDEEFTARIPPGPGTTVLKRRLKFKPSALYLVTNTPANVVVDGGEVVGRARSVIQVPHQRQLHETHKISVTAPGYRDYTGEVQLRAGRLTTVNVTLTSIEGE